MNNRTYILPLPTMGISWVTVDYFQNHPIYIIKSLENNKADIILYMSKEGRWQQDGSGVNDLSEAIGNAIEQAAK